MIEFQKMHGLGNDFVIIDRRDSGALLPVEQIRAIADRHRGVGFDQLVLLLPPTLPDADVLVRFFNADGSEAGACGNATRCIARLLLQDGKRDKAVVQTQAGRLPVWRAGQNKQGEALYAVDIAQPVFDWQKIPLAKPQDTLWLDMALGPLPKPAAVNVGNPHVTYFVDDVTAVDLLQWGPQAEHHILLPERANIEFCQILDQDKMRMRVWERSTGITQSCATGACASLVSAVRRGLLQRRAEVIQDGGSLFIEWRDDDRVILIGTASAVFSGVFAPEFAA